MLSKGRHCGMNRALHSSSLPSLGLANETRYSGLDSLYHNDVPFVELVKQLRQLRNGIRYEDGLYMYS